MADNPILKAALGYVKRGLSVFPCSPFPDKERSDGTVFKNKQPYLSFIPYRDRTPTEDEIRQWWSKWPDAMIGCITGKAPNNLTIIDADSEQAFQELQEYLPESYQTKIAKSPNGYHLYFKHFEGPPNSSRIMESAIKDVDCRTDGGYIIMPPSINQGNGQAKKYEWLTHEAVEEVPESLKSIIINSLYRDVTNSIGDNHNKSQVVTGSHIDLRQGKRDESLFHIANCLVKGGMPEIEVIETLRVIAKSCNPPFPENELNIKIKSAFERADRKVENIAKDVYDWILVTPGNFSVTDYHRESQLVTKEQKHTANVAFTRYTKDGLIERYGDKRGYYRTIEKDYDAVCFDDIEIGDRLNVRLPFALERYVEIMPKDLIVFAGVPNSGKSSVMMECAGLNQNLAECWYFSSEMGRVNWKKRLLKYDGGSKVKWNYKFVDDFPNFVDVIKPDAFNFIDYVEVADGEFYKIPSILAAIQKKLKTGIAFVALQKNTDKTYGVGGQQTLAKPALFLTIDPDYPRGAVMKVAKAKNYINENPNGFQIKFKIHNGINLKPSGVWMPEMEGK